MAPEGRLMQRAEARLRSTPRGSSSRALLIDVTGGRVEVASPYWRAMGDAVQGGIFAVAGADGAEVAWRAFVG